MTEEPITKFQAELQTYFPDLALLLQIGKTDPRLDVVIKSIVEMWKLKSYGKLEVTYQEGKINHVLQTVSKK
jgi:hypothetical protein